MITNSSLVNTVNKIVDRQRKTVPKWNSRTRLGYHKWDRESYKNFKQSIAWIKGHQDDNMPKTSTIVLIVSTIELWSYRRTRKHSTRSRLDNNDGLGLLLVNEEHQRISKRRVIILSFDWFIHPILSLRRLTLLTSSFLCVFLNFRHRAPKRRRWLNVLVLYKSKSIKRSIYLLLMRDKYLMNIRDR